jgi:hypothetical protein
VGLLAHIFWFGHPSQALAFPASCEFVPGQLTGAPGTVAVSPIVCNWGRRRKMGCLSDFVRNRISGEFSEFFLVSFWRRYQDDVLA